VRQRRLWLTVITAGLDARVQGAVTPVGDEFQVNSITSNYQMLPAVTDDDDGDFVVVWESLFLQDSSGSGIFGQRFDSSGAKRSTTTSHR
jgi:hypothetical protein